MLSIFIIALWLVVVQASGVPGPDLEQAITALTTSQIDALTPFAYYTKAVFCDPSAVLSWTCGVACEANDRFERLAVGGDGNGIQYWYVGYDPSLDTVIVAHQGTNRTQILAILTNLNMFLGKLDPTLFPGLPSGIKVHSGFRDAHARTAPAIISSVITALSKYGTTSVTIVGHSLGAALSLLDSVYLPLHFPPDTRFQAILYGLPRVGNQAFADYVDMNLNVTRIHYAKDNIPTIPGMFMGYVHPSGEIRITEAGEWLMCPGQDNPSVDCIVGAVSNFFVGYRSHHKGPYNGVKMPC